GSFLEACRDATGSDARFVWIDDATLAQHGVAPWKEMPLFVPESEPHADGFMSVPIARALATGLAFRPLRQTIADTLAWQRRCGRRVNWCGTRSALRPRGRRARSPAGKPGPPRACARWRGPRRPAAGRRQRVAAASRRRHSTCARDR